MIKRLIYLLVVVVLFVNVYFHYSEIVKYSSVLMEFLYFASFQKSAIFAVFF